MVEVGGLRWNILVSVGFIFYEHYLVSLGGKIGTVVETLQYTQCITLAIAMLEPGCESITFEISWSRQQCLSNLESQNQDENESQSRRSKD